MGENNGWDQVLNIWLVSLEYILAKANDCQHCVMFIWKVQQNYKLFILYLLDLYSIFLYFGVLYFSILAVYMSSIFNFYLWLAYLL